MLLQILPEKVWTEFLKQYYTPAAIDVFKLVAKGENEDFSTEFRGILVLSCTSSGLPKGGFGQDFSWENLEEHSRADGLG